MTQVIQQRVAESLGAFREVLTNPNLRRVQLGFVGSIVGYWPCRWRWLSTRTVARAGGAVPSAWLRASPLPSLTLALDELQPGVGELDALRSQARSSSRAGRRPAASKSA
jgi:hypothetical protein